MTRISSDRFLPVGYLITVDDFPFIVTSCEPLPAKAVDWYTVEGRELTAAERAHLAPRGCGFWKWSNGTTTQFPEDAPTLKSIVLKVESQPEMYAGELTGKTVFYATRFATEYVPMAGVLGRGATSEASVADWKRRATDDGHDLSNVVFTVNS